MNYLSKLAIISLSCLALSACITVPKDEIGQTTNGAYPAAGQYSGNVQTGGIGGDSVGVYLGNAYSTRAPSNQTYYFAFDSDNVHQAYFPSIIAQAKYLATHPRSKIRLEGNTDARGSREYNIGLGERRADAVAQVMEQYGAKQNQIIVVSYGEEKPAVPGVTAKAFQLNRRVNLIYK